MTTKTPSYILELKLKTQVFEIDILEKRFEIGRKMYNACLSELLKRKKMMKNDNLFIQWISKPKSKERNTILKDLLKKYLLNEYSMHGWIKTMQQHFSKHIDANTGQKIATRAWKSIEKLLFDKDTKAVRFKKYGTMDSLEGKTNKQGIRFKENVLFWNGLSIPVIVRKNDVYAHLALIDKVKYCRIFRKQIKGKSIFYLQLVLEGYPPKKINNSNSEAQNRTPEGDVGIDIGTQTIAVSSKDRVLLDVLAPSVANIERKIRIIRRKMDRSKRATNPNKYLSNGVIDINDTAKWVFSNRYKELRNQLKEINRKISVKKKQDHEILSNYILSLGTTIKVETMNFKGLQKRAKETAVNEKTGKFNRKKRFGKSIGNRAPSMLLSIINRKLNYIGKELIKVDTFSLKASQFNHVENSYEKKKLSKRWNTIEGFKVQRDCYSAYLLQHVNDDGKSYNMESLKQDFDEFLRLHESEINRLKLDGITLSSMGI